MTLPIENRAAAGRDLAEALAARRGRTDILVLALPRGGVPVAYEIASALDAPLDLMLVRKLGTPGHEELAMGAIASGGARVLNRNVIDSLRIPGDVIERVAAAEQRELERREQAYRGARARPQIAGRCVVLVDDGVATGATMRAAIEALRQHAPAEIVVAVPVAPPDTVSVLRAEADDVVCLETPSQFGAISLCYREFRQTSDAEVVDLLERAWTRESG